MTRLLFLVFTYIWQEDFAKISLVLKAPRKVNAVRLITWLVSVSIYYFSITIQLHPASFYSTKYLKKLVGKMLIEQIIEFYLRGRGRTCTPTTGYFYDKTKTSKECLRVDYFIIFC